MSSDKVGQAAYYLTEWLRQLQLNDYDIAQILARQVVALCGMKDLNKAKPAYAQLNKKLPLQPCPRPSPTSHHPIGRTTMEHQYRRRMIKNIIVKAYFFLNTRQKHYIFINSVDFTIFEQNVKKFRHARVLRDTYWDGIKVWFHCGN